MYLLLLPCTTPLFSFSTDAFDGVGRAMNFDLKRLCKEKTGETREEMGEGEQQQGEILTMIRSQANGNKIYMLDKGNEDER